MRLAARAVRSTRGGSRSKTALGVRDQCARRRHLWAHRACDL